MSSDLGCWVVYGPLQGAGQVDPVGGGACSPGAGCREPVGKLAPRAAGRRSSSGSVTLVPAPGALGHVLPDVAAAWALCGQAEQMPRTPGAGTFLLGCSLWKPRERKSPDSNP